MLTLSLLSTLRDKFAITDLNLFLVNLIVAVIFIVVGILLGGVVKFILKRILEKADVARATTKSFIALFLTVIRWSIYILFIVLALEQLNIPQLTSWIIKVLVVVPAFVGALILIAAGFGIAVYLRDMVEESGILNRKILGMILFYFVLYIFLVFALKTALISQDKQTVNIISIILTAIFSVGIVFWHFIRR